MTGRALSTAQMAALVPTVADLLAAVEYDIQGDIATATSAETGAIVAIVLRRAPMPMDFTLPGRDPDAVYDCRVSKLYANDAPSGFVRKMLCVLVDILVERGSLRRNGSICLEASGDVRGSRVALVHMYERMGFQIVSTMSAAMYDAFVRGDDAALATDPDPMSFVMAQSIGGLMGWCNRVPNAKSNRDGDRF